MAKMYHFQILNPKQEVIFDSHKEKGSNGYARKQSAKTSAIGIAGVLVKDYEFVEAVILSETEDENQTTEFYNQ